MHSHAKHGNEGDFDMKKHWFTKIKYYDRMMLEERAYTPS